MLETSVQILRGADTIGGSCIKIKHGDQYILLDYGMPLMASGGGDLGEGVTNHPSLDNGMLIDATAGETCPPVALLISHAHPDHYGLIDHFNSAPVYMNALSRAMLNIARVFYPPNMQVNNLDRIQILPLAQELELGPFTVKAFPVDHSAFDACSIMVSVGDKRIFYTGDFRGHGTRHLESQARILEEASGCDALLMEGTTLDRNHSEVFESEKSVEAQLYSRCVSSNASIMVAAAGGNVDRLLSMYQAAKQSGRKLVIDLYQLHVLESLQKYDPSLPPHDGDHLLVYYTQSQAKTMAKEFGKQSLYVHHHRQIKDEQIDLSDGRYIFRLSLWYLTRISKLYLNAGIKPQLVYSMWKGYMDKQDGFSKLSALTDAEWEYIHTSGHAYSSHLKAFAKSLAPKKLIPIHTLNGKTYPDTFANVHIVENGGSLVI
jgi:ribonuclease J